MTHPLLQAVRPVSDLVDLVAGRDLVLLGEATHGTREFYALRADVTRRLVRDHGFRAVAWEADPPPAVALTRWLRGEEDGPAATALRPFADRFPTWMWANETVRDLVEALRGADAGIYGLDLYSLRSSMEAVVTHLEEVDPVAAARVRERYACFDHLDDQGYGYATATGRKDPCEDEVVAALVEVRARVADGGGAADGRGGTAVRDGEDGRDAADGARRAGGTADDADARFAAEQNARVAVDAERYYRAMYRGRESTWNLRDRHMADTLDALLVHAGGPVVVWAHNSHVGDARATSRADVGEVTLGQLVRERHGDRAALVGLTTATGTVTAAHDWGDPPRTREVRPPLESSVERLLHDAGVEEGLLDLRGPARELLDRPLLQRMIGVVYRPETERQSHYVDARVADQYDVLVHLDRTSHVVPLDAAATGEDDGDAPETLPTGL